MNQPKHNRNYGIDLLRLVAAFYVVVLHTVNHGGIYLAATPQSDQELVCRILLIASFCAVNIFGIISGYVGYREPVKSISYSGYLPLWLTVVFYSVVNAVIYKILLPGSVTGTDFFTAFFPVTNDLYWYFSAYTLVYFFSPYLNRMLYDSSEKELKQLFVLICCLCVIVEYVGSPFALEGGYSALWLLLLYLAGGILKKTGIGSKLSAPAALLLILLIDVGFLFLGQKHPELTLFTFRCSLDIRYGYVTPVYMATAILHVIAFSRFRFGRIGQSIIRFAAPAAFSVYIVNTNPLFWKNFMESRFSGWAFSSPLGLLARTLLFSAVFVSAVVIADFFRQKLFALLGVPAWGKKLSGFLAGKKNP